MVFDCRGSRCQTPRWMKLVLSAAGAYHLMFGIWANFWPHQFFDWAGLAHPNHLMLWRGLGLVAVALGIGLMIAARSPIRHWTIVLTAFIKANLVIITSVMAMIEASLPGAVIAMVIVDDLIWWLPLAMILWASAETHVGRPPSRAAPLTLDQAASEYTLSSGETLAEAGRDQTLAMVFLRHFGCTFTRQILRRLEGLKREADRHGARLVLVHMLEEGRETDYLDSRDQVARIADPRCELYRAFGLGKGGFCELFGPQVWWPMAVALVRGCGIGHLAGDGLQLPGAFLFRDGKILSSQRPKTQAHLPDLERLFEELPEPEPAETVPA